MASCPAKESLADQLNHWFPQMEEVVHLAESLSEMLLSTAVDAYNLTIEVIPSAVPVLCL